MKKLLGSLAIVVALGSAVPTMASDVTGDRYSPYRTAPTAPRSTPQIESSREAQPAKAPCACPCMKSAESASRATDGR